MFAVVIILAVSLILGSNLASTSKFLTCNCSNNDDCFSNGTCHVSLSNGACFIDTSKHQLVLGCCINNHMLSSCRTYGRICCQTENCNVKDLATLGTDGRNIDTPTLPPFTLPTGDTTDESPNSSRGSQSATPTEQFQSQGSQYNDTGSEQSGTLYLSLFVLCTLVLLVMIVVVSTLILIIHCKIKELDTKKYTTKEAII